MRKHRGGGSGTLSWNNVDFCTWGFWPSLYCTRLEQSERTRVKQEFIHYNTLSSFSCDKGQLCGMQKAPCTEGVNLLQWPKMGKLLRKARDLLRNYKCHSLMHIKNLFLYLILPFMIHFSNGWYWIFWKAKDSRERDVTVRKTADKPVNHIFCWSKSLSFQLSSLEIYWFTWAEDLALDFQELTVDDSKIYIIVLLL